jgi:hypothetical protein
MTLAGFGPAPVGGYCQRRTGGPEFAKEVSTFRNCRW